VLDRFYQAAVFYKADPVIRITGDCPFLDPDVVERLIAFYSTGDYDHTGVAAGAGALRLEGGRFPDGLDAECFSFASLERAWREAAHPLDREHVTPYIWRNRHLFRCALLASQKDYSDLRWTVDNEEDFTLVSRVYEALYDERKPFLMADILQYLSDNPDLAESNRHFIGKERYAEIWSVADGDQSLKEEERK
jgi:spore coat polysaccharide biosynthesis protein SpsF